MVILLNFMFLNCMYAQQNFDWGNDVVVSPREPSGMTLLQGPGDTLYFDIVQGNALREDYSYNRGDSWGFLANYFTIGGPAGYGKIEFVKSDTLYAVYFQADSLFIKKLLSPHHKKIMNEQVKDFDVVSTSSGTIYLLLSFKNNDSLKIISTVDGGINWSKELLITDKGSRGRFSKFLYGDTLLINYYDINSIRGNDSTSVSAMRYTESAPGELTAIDTNSIEVINDSEIKPEFKSIIGRDGVVWFFYTSGIYPNRDVKLKTSTDYGVTYSNTVDIATDPLIDECGLEADYNMYANRCDLVYHWNDLSPIPSIESSKIVYSFSTQVSPRIFSEPLSLNQHPAIVSPGVYNPILAEFNDSTADVGVVWVGLDGTEKKTYWDRLHNTTFININITEIPLAYMVNQNYPNPFNPLTQIEFEAPKDGRVSLKVYNILGEEVAVLVNENVKSGKYRVSFDGTKLASGVYFYTLEAPEYRETKKMLLIK